MRRTLTAIALAAAALTAGCDSPTDGGVEPGLAVFARTGVITLSNTTDAPLYYVILERETAIVANWAPCATPANCPGVEPGGETAIRYQDVSGYEPGDSEALLTSYRLTASAGGTWKATDFRTTVVSLQ